MSSIYEAKEEMHQIEAQLYPNHLAGGENTYLAKNLKEKTINVDAICAAMRNRGGYDGSHDEAVKTVNHFFKEMMYQLCDGFSVNTGWFTINVHIGGLFHSVKEIFDPKKHHVTFKFHMLKAMKKLTSLIEITINGHIEETAYISEFKDMEDPEGNNFFEPGHVCEIVGRRIKIEGPAAETGLWMVPLMDPSKAVKINRVVSNNASRIEFIPVATDYSDNRLEIRTRYSEGGTLLHNIRTITSQFAISQA
jgi:hypothetical protein